MLLLFSSIIFENIGILCKLIDSLWRLSQDVDVAVQKATRAHLPEDVPKEKHVIGALLMLIIHAILIYKTDKMG
jgi:hypothetical protein